MNNKSIKGYMCSINWNYELGRAAGGTPIYCSIEDLKINHKCWKECGIVKVEVKFKQQVVKENLNRYTK